MPSSSVLETHDHPGVFHAIPSAIGGIPSRIGAVKAGMLADITADLKALRKVKLVTKDGVMHKHP